VSIRDIERAITAAAREQLRNPKLRLKDLLAWQNGEIEPRDGEVVVEVDALGMHWWCVFERRCDKR